MSSGAYVRRWTTEPDAATLTDIESINIIDTEAPATFAGVQFGRAGLVGEFEDGPFNTPSLVSDQDFGEGKTFGGFGFTTNGLRSQNPTARQRAADAAIADEFWNGNAFLSMQGKKFSSLVCTRVDTSVGNVQFSRIASILGAAKTRYTLANGQTIIANLGASDTTITFMGTVANVTGANGVFGSISAGDKAVLGYDTAPDFTVTFLGTDTSVANCVARINQYAGFTFAANSGGQIALAGLVQGLNGEVRVVSGTALANLGLTVGDTPGNGNVGDITQVTAAELNTVTAAANVKLRIDRISNGRIRIANYGDGASGALEIKSTYTATDLAWTPLDTFVFANTGTSNGVIPAGTVVQDSGGTHVFVTMQSIAVAKNNAGPYSVKVRHALDDGTGSSLGVGLANVMPFQLAFDAFSVDNITSLTACLTESQLDAAYSSAILATKDINTPAKKINVQWSARQSNSVRRDLLQNALDCSAAGLFGRMACVRPPMGTSKAIAMSDSEPGVGPYRNERLVYCYPGASVRISAIASIGTAGGTGFTSDGVIDQGADGFMASSMSMLPAGENPAQDGGFLTAVLGLESSSFAQGFDIDDYIAFRAAGICALRMDDGEAVFQSGVTSVDPEQHPNQTDIERRTLADFIEDSIAVLWKPYSKKKMTLARIVALNDATRTFLDGLLGAPDGSGQRLDSYSLSPKQNTPELRAQGRYRLVFKGKSVPSFKSIELVAEVGPGVTIDEIA